VNEQEKDHMRFLASCFAMNGYLSKMACNPKDQGTICEGDEDNAEAIGKASVIMADALIDALEPKETTGLPPIRSRKAKAK
jgi:hypothetical protein